LVPTSRSSGSTTAAANNATPSRKGHQDRTGGDIDSEVDSSAFESATELVGSPFAI
jgi:hypothetical protein